MIIHTFLGAVRVPSTSNKAINPGFVAAIGVQCKLSATKSTKFVKLFSTEKENINCLQFNDYSPEKTRNLKIM